MKKSNRKCEIEKMLTSAEMCSFSVHAISLVNMEKLSKFLDSLLASGIEKFRCQDGTVEVKNDCIILNFTDTIVIRKTEYKCCVIYDFRNTGIGSHITYTFMNGKFDTAHMHLREEVEKEIKPSFRKVE